MGEVQQRRIRAAYVNVILDGRLAFRYDPWRGLVEVQHRGVKHVVDLAQIEAQEQQQAQDADNQNGDICNRK